MSSRHSVLIAGAPLGLAPSTPIVSPGAARMLRRRPWAAREGEHRFNEYSG